MDFRQYSKDNQANAGFMRGYMSPKADQGPHLDGTDESITEETTLTDDASVTDDSHTEDVDASDSAAMESQGMSLF